MTLKGPVVTLGFKHVRQDVFSRPYCYLLLVSHSICLILGEAAADVQLISILVRPHDRTTADFRDKPKTEQF